MQDNFQLQKMLSMCKQLVASSVAGICSWLG
jgi:hypothetical protein